MKATSRESPVELGNYDGTLCRSGSFERLGEGRAAIEGIGSLAGLDFSKFLNDQDAFRFGETGHCSFLRLDAPT